MRGVIDQHEMVCRMHILDHALSGYVVTDNAEAAAAVRDAIALVLAAEPIDLFDVVHIHVVPRDRVDAPESWAGYVKDRFVYFVVHRQRSLDCKAAMSGCGEILEYGT